MEPSSDILAFREVLTSAKRLVILAGAGLSAGSGGCYGLYFYWSQMRNQY